MVCVEVCSAAYVFDGTMRTSVVNSLFGDGAAGIALRVGVHEDGPSPASPVPALVKTSSHIIPDTIEAMRYDWDGDQNRFNFFLDPDVPYVVGANIEQALEQLLAGTGLQRWDVDHWLVHSGGKKVIDSLRINIGLSRHDVRHTLSVLRDLGNVSSGSFLFSYERLVAEGVVAAGDLGVMITMGPGATIEMALLEW
jgi:predicted naringenin-chalcone synthase